MKKRDLIDLIKCYATKNDSEFFNVAYRISEEFEEMGDYEISEYIRSIISNENAFVPQGEALNECFAYKAQSRNEPLYLPDPINEDIKGLINAVSHNVGINKFLFEGFPGTGKTQTALELARILDRDLYIVDFTSIIDSKMGQTSKNIADLFNQINGMYTPSEIIILFDEIDAIAMDRTNSQDIREMGRATTSILKGMDSLHKEIVFIATTNLYDSFDKALTRRFDKIISFNRYTNEDLKEVALSMYDYYISIFKSAQKNTRFYKKILDSTSAMPYPADIKRIIKTSFAFSSPDDPNEYFKRLYSEFLKESPTDVEKLAEQGFSLREIEILTGVSKSQVSRLLKEELSE